ncbi:MAG: hypothetical protein KJ000_31860 [Pirellulaceae bacterium]|nr:hypothetical protein [Pirellulaceae bacterium]
MKSQHRHELQTNELADTLGVYMQRIQPYARQIGLGILAVLVLVVVGIYANNQRLARAGAGWSDYFQAFAQRDPKALGEVARLHSGNPAALWAEQAAGDILLATGAGQMFSDRDEAETSLRSAEKHYKAVEQAAARQPMLLNRARYGLAQTYETLAEIEKARGYYEKVFQAEGNSSLGRDAKGRFDDLSQNSTERWYAWFERQEPPQPESGAGGFDPNVPDDLDFLPNRPDLSFPGSSTPVFEPPIEPESPPPTEPMESEATTEPETPAEPTTPADPGAPSESEPAEPKEPAESEKPEPAPPAESAKPEPESPAEPEMPAEPVKPEPEAPAEPTPPAEPEKPAEAETTPEQPPVPPESAGEEPTPLVPADPNPTP